MKDFMTRPGAEHLCRLITQYWAKKGYEVEVYMSPPPMDNPTFMGYSVRSNLVDALPRDYTGNQSNIELIKKRR